MKSATALLSGGLDSVTSLALAMAESKIVLALTFDYGQRAAEREIHSAKYFCKLWGIPHKVMELPWLTEITKTALVNRDTDLGNKSPKDVWVPNRNGLFINIAASFCDALDIDAIITGFNAEEAEEFRDNSKIFVEEINKALSHSTLKRPKVKSLTQQINKPEILEAALKLKIPLEKLWCCYDGGEKHCGVCGSCKKTIAALRSINKWDDYRKLFNL